jgi:hypothetical protein
MTTSDDLGGVLLNGQNDGAMTDAPRYCVTRYEVWETTAPVITPATFSLPARCEWTDAAHTQANGYSYNVGDYIIPNPEDGTGPRYNSNGVVQGYGWSAGSWNTQYIGGGNYGPYDYRVDKYCKFGWTYFDGVVASPQSISETPRDWRVLGGTFSLWTEISNVKLQN